MFNSSITTYKSKTNDISYIFSHEYIIKHPKQKSGHNKRGKKK